MTNAITVVQTGQTVTATSTAQTFSTPVTSASATDVPRLVRVVSDGPAYIKFGTTNAVTATQNDAMVSNNPSFFKTRNLPFFSVVYGFTQATATVNLTATSVASYTVGANGTGYTSPPTVAVTGGGGTGATGTAVVGLFSGSTNTPGSAYLVNDTITLAGGTFSVAAIATVNTLKLNSLAGNAAGTSYLPGDSITLTGGTFTVAPILQVSTVKAVSATISNGGSGYGASQTFNVTVVGIGGVSAAVINVSSNAGGVVTTVNSVTTAGSYTAVPINPCLTTSPSGGGSAGTGLTLNLSWGVNIFTISNPGNFTVGSASLTQSATSGAGTGATFNTATFGVNTFTVSTKGNYTVSSASTLTQGTTSGSGTGFILGTPSFGVVSITLGAGGSGFTGTPSVALTGGGGAGATATANLTGTTIASITLTGAGNGYLSAPTATITGGGGTSGAVGTNTITGGYVTATGSITAGSGYTSTPTCTFTGGYPVSGARVSVVPCEDGA